MQNLLRNGGPVDIAMGWLGVLVSAMLLIKGIALAQHGASLWWPVIAGAMVVLSLHALYRRRRDSGQDRV
ncbi:hypothetical protein [Streptomyces sp. NPDC002215]|uniref:hypothetical protein n=1 Tax=Streptomyces sp. NPDC002215 TaxID=3154412 RepID=UPI0033226DA0